MQRRICAFSALSSIALLSACASGPRLSMDMSAAELSRPGVICPTWLHLDPDRGCTTPGEGLPTLRVVEEMRMSEVFVPVSALYVLDGRVIYHWKPSGEGAGPRDRTPIFDAHVPAGPHTLWAVHAYKGHGYGVFQYLSGYRFEVRSAHPFQIGAWDTLTVTATAHENGGPTTPLEERPAISWTQALGPP